MTTLLTQARKTTAAPVADDLLLERVDLFRLDACRRLAPHRRSEMGQFLTPAPVAELMASMFSLGSDRLRVLDAGAGVGSLSAALVTRVCRGEYKPRDLHVTAFEIEPILVDYLLETFELCAAVCRSAGIRFVGEVRKEDFIGAGVGALMGRGLFPGDVLEFDAAILNPPYRKINNDTEIRRRLSCVGIETTNLYSAFLWLSEKLMRDGGELVAITPRSFCNGPYFQPFRKALLGAMNFRRFHVFESRDRAFSEDEVLQENVIVHAVKETKRGTVSITSSGDPGDPDVVVRDVEYRRLIRPDDVAAFIHLVPDEMGERIAEAVRGMPATLDQLGLAVSTGRVVDFRSKELLRGDPGADTVPLIYPTHFSAGFISWPKLKGRKPNALAVAAESDDLLVRAGYYVLAKRFSAKEETRRVVAAVYDPSRVPGDRVGFENHLNYYHRKGGGLAPALAKGLAAYLNSTLVDAYFRQFNGHTQVNAADLRSLRYPILERMTALGQRIGDTFPPQDELDRLVREEVIGMADDTENDPVEAKKMISRARSILESLGVPKDQQNDRSALTLLALLGMKPGTAWRKAGAPLLGITEMMEHFRDDFGVRYAPNTRETVRRFTIHQFVQLGLVLANPDKPDRPVNSPDNRYQIEPAALKLIRTFGTAAWDKALPTYLATVEGLKRLHAREREMSLIPVALPDGSAITLTAGGQNVLIKDILEKFCPRFTPGGKVIAFGDAGDKPLGFNEDYLKGLGVTLPKHGKMPDVVIHYPAENWLVLVEAVTSHGPMNLKRHNELKQLFAGSTAGLVFVTAFLTRKAMVKYLGEIAWETEVWIAETPSHLIHFNGERFLGPYR